MKEFVDFLGGQAPYDALPVEDLHLLGRAVEVEYFPAGTVIAEAGSGPLTHLYVVRAGAVEVLDRGRVVDLLGEGDTFGHVSVLSGLPSALTMRAAEDTLAYLLPDPRTILAHPHELRFAHYSTTVVPERTRTRLLEAARRPVNRYLRSLVWAEPGTTVREAARRVSDAGQSCAIIDTGARLGIVTDQDFRRLLAADRPDLDAPVAAIASSPALTVRDDTAVTTAFLEMIEHGVHHLVVTDSAERPIGVVRVVDLASAEVRDPLLVRSAVEAATTVDELTKAAALLPATIVELDDNGIPPTQVGALLSAVVDAILYRLIAIQASGGSIDSVAASASWLVLGSRARRESLPNSDVDTALVWPDSRTLVNPAPGIRQAAEWILTALERTGFSRCPDGANATNPLLSRSSSDWAAAAAQWVRDPRGEAVLLLASVVADSRPITGLALGRSVTDAMLATTVSRHFLSALLRFTLQDKPPTGFVRDFVVEHSGEHRGQLDLKRAGLRPLSSLGRWIAVVTRDTSGSTPDRLRRGEAAGLLTQGEADALVGAFQEVYELVFAREVAAIRSGTPIGNCVAARDLDPLTRRFLRETFREIAQIQGVLHGEWVTRLA